MKWPLQRAAEAKAEAEAAKAEYEQTVQDASRVTEVLTMLFHHAEPNEFVEKIQQVARGHG